MVQALWRTVWRFLKKLKIKLPYDPAIPLLDIYPKTKHGPKGYMHPNVHCSTVYNSQDMEQTKCPSTEELIKKMGTYIQ